eukprot:5342032-Pleurochrysis_carterae.AAC.1
MDSPKVVGVFVGEHEHGIAGMSVNVAHFIDASAFGPDESPAGEGIRASRPRNAKATVDAIREARKGYHNFRCGDR